MHSLFKLSRTTLAVTIGTLCLSPLAMATNGLAPIGLGMEHRSMGGVAAGYAANTTSMATNPASAAFVLDGYDVGLEFFMPDRSATDKTTGTEYSGNDKTVFLVPEFAYKRKVNQKVDAGVAIYGNGGMNTGYSNPPPAPPAGNGFGTGKLGVDYQQLFVAPTASYKLNDRHAIGASANLVYHKIKIDGAHGFDNVVASVNPGSVTNNGYDSSTGVGFTVGWQGQLTDRLSAGVSYRSKVEMGKLDKYKGLFANGGEFDVPASTNVGIAYKATPKTTIGFDVARIEYSDVASMGNPSTRLAPNPNNPTAGVRMGSDDGPGFGWKDQTVYKIGVKHQATPNVAVMAGLNYGKTPVQSTDTKVGVIAPATVEKHISLGTQVKLSPKSKLTASYIYVPENEVKGTNTHAGHLDSYDLSMEQHAVGVAYSREF